MLSIPDTTFEEFLTNEINISPAQREQGSKSHNYIRTLLDNKSSRDPKFPLLVDGDFLSGSYARHTKIWPLDDIDVMVVLDGAGLHAIQNGVKLNATVRSSETKENPILQHLGINGLLSSKKVLELFQEALKQSHPNSTVSKDGQAINVWLEGPQMGIDVVPCFHIIPADGTRDFYYIPDGKTDGWMSTNPNIDKEISDWLHTKHNKKIKGTVKLLKFWNKTQNASRLESYHLETVAWYVFGAHPSAVTDYAGAIKYFFENASNHIATSCPDITKLGGPVDSYLSLDDRQKTLAKIAEAQQFFKSTGLLLIPEQKKVSNWRKIFNDNFAS